MKNKFIRIVLIIVCCFIVCGCSNIKVIRNKQLKKDEVVKFVEDDLNIRKLVCYALEKEGYAVKGCSLPSEFWQEMNREIPQLILLDIMLPEEDGLSILGKLQAENSTSNIPVIMITAKDSEFDKVTGLDMGADDYLTKPFSVDELLARLRVTQRRLGLLQNAGNVESAVYVNGKLRIDYSVGCAYMNEEELHLTPIEYKLLCLLARNTGKVLTHKFITQSVWGSSWENDIVSLRVFMATLRKKLESGDDSAQYIQTHIGVGYRMLKVE